MTTTVIDDAAQIGGENAAESAVEVEVVWLSPQQQFRQRVSLPVGSTVWHALCATDVLAHTGQTWPVAVGVFGVRVEDATQHLLQQGDRVELYRPLTCDPKEVRRQRAGRYPVGRRRVKARL